MLKHDARLDQSARVPAKHAELSEKRQTLGIIGRKVLITQSDRT